MDVHLNEVPTAAPSPDSEVEPIFELGGPAFRFMQRIGIIQGMGPSIGRRTVAFIAITWIPLLLLSAVDGHAIGSTPRSSFLLDYASYARFFVAVPLIFAAEMIVGRRIRSAGLRFVHAGLVHGSDHAEFHAAVERARRRRDAGLPELLFLALALFGAWFATIEELGGLGAATWHTLWSSEGHHIAWAGIWYYFVAIPLVQFFLLRWLWRSFIWTAFLWDVSRLRLSLVPTHADRAAGLGFLGVAHTSFAIFPFAMSCVLAAELAFRIRFEGLDLVSLRSMAPLLVAYLLFAEMVSFGPLLIFVPLLSRTRLDGLRSYGELVQRHNQLFHEKWILEQHNGEPLGNSDMSSLIDLGDSFSVIREMSVFPAGRRQLIQVAVIACLPGLPLTLLLLPFGEVMKLLMGVVM